MVVIDRDTGKSLSNAEILIEVNRDRSEEWTDYNQEDLDAHPADVASWIDSDYYDCMWLT